MIEDRYPGADILKQRGHWDTATRKVILDRVHNVPEFKHFHGRARATLEALCARVIPQGHCPPNKRVSLAPWIDQKCGQPVVGGFRFDNMPSNTEAWNQGLEGVDQTARALYGRDFVDLSEAEQDDVLNAIRAGDPPGDVWRQLPANRWWRYTCVRQIAGTYYAHPAAWDEIGFGGPAYPRGYFALNHGAPEPWETRPLDVQMPAHEPEQAAR